MSPTDDTNNRAVGRSSSIKVSPPNSTTITAGVLACVKHQRFILVNFPASATDHQTHLRDGVQPYCPASGHWQRKRQEGFRTPRNTSAVKGRHALIKDAGSQYPTRRQTFRETKHAMRERRFSFLSVQRAVTILKKNKCCPFTTAHKKLLSSATTFLNNCFGVAVDVCFSASYDFEDT
ncbi:unnamed protein product [Ectocarpus sp. 12 AP-2014]